VATTGGPTLPILKAVRGVIFSSSSAALDDVLVSDSALTLPARGRREHSHIRLVLLKWFCRMASQGRVLLFGVTGGGFKAGIRSCHAVHAPETLPVLCMG